MNRQTTLIILGAVVALSPFFGVPSSWLIRIDVIAGFAIAYLGYSLRHLHNPSITRQTVEQ